MEKSVAPDHVGSSDSASSNHRTPYVEGDNYGFEKESRFSEPESEDSTAHDDAHAGVARIAAINRVLTTHGEFTIGKYQVQPLKWILLFFLLLQGYATGLDGNMSGIAQAYAANQFKNAPLSGTINTVKSVVAASVIVPYARLSDRFGRIESWCGALIIYLVGRIVCAATPNVGGLFAGVVIWEFGYAGFRFLATALTADISELRNRTFAMNIYLIPIIINLWVSGNIVSDIAEGKNKWRWDFGIGCITVPATTFLLIVPYAYGQYIAKRNKTLPPLRFKRPEQTTGQAAYEFIMRLDLVGILLFAASLALILVPLTLAGGAATKWRRGYIIAMIVVGGCLLFVFLLWEWLVSPAPFIPKKRLEPTFYAALAIEFLWRTALTIELNYVTFILQVGFNQSTLSTQRLGQMYDFLQSCTNIVVGILLHFWPHPKPFAVFGSMVGMVGMGLLYKYRTAYDGGISGYIGADVVVGIGGGLMRFPTWTLVHAGIPHDQMAIATAFMMSMYQVGASVGSAVATAVWTQRLAKRLVKNLGPKIGMEVYKSPLGFAKKYPLGTPIRDGILDAYSYIQHLLIIISICLTGLVVLLTFVLRSYVVGTEQSFTDEERDEKIREMNTGKMAWLKRLIGY